MYYRISAITGGVQSMVVVSLRISQICLCGTTETQKKKNGMIYKVTVRDICGKYLVLIISVQQNITQ